MEQITGAWKEVLASGGLSQYSSILLLVGVSTLVVIVVQLRFTAKKLKTYEMLRTQEMAAMVENPTNSAPVHIHSITAAVPLNILFTLAVGKRFDSLPNTDELREYPAMVDEITKIIMEFNIV